MTSFHNFFLHLYPVKVPKEIVGTRATLRLGFIAATLYGILFISGMYLMFFYHPATPDAYFDMHSLSTAVAFGQFVRNVHRWSAHLMVLVVFLHLMRVFYSGAYRRPRQFNWVIGVLLLVLTLLLSFTGYLLPWDQLAIWAITVGSNMARATPFLGHEGPGASLLRLGDVPLIHAQDDARFALLGGTFVGEGALLRFYVLHCVGLPLGIAVLMAVHFWRVRKDGGISGPL
jgi:quinol-cytochrome oxidoreductase complex cytochrome b subunit